MYLHHWLDSRHDLIIVVWRQLVLELGLFSSELVGCCASAIFRGFIEDLERLLILSLGLKCLTHDIQTCLVLRFWWLKVDLVWLIDLRLDRRWLSINSFDLLVDLIYEFICQNGIDMKRLRILKHGFDIAWFFDIILQFLWFLCLGEIVDFLRLVIISAPIFLVGNRSWSFGFFGLFF